MLNLAAQTNDVADHTLRELDSQNEKLKNQQEEVAEIHDALNVSERKLRGIKSFWGNIGNAFKKKTKVTSTEKKEKNMKKKWQRAN